MADCDIINGCIFFNDKMSKYPSTAELMKKTYCKGSKETCARYMVYSKLGKANVPSNLYPDELERAKKIIEDAK